MTQLGAASLLFRQTNIVWLAYIAAASVVRQLQLSGDLVDPPLASAGLRESTSIVTATPALTLCFTQSTFRAQSCHSPRNRRGTFVKSRPRWQLTCQSLLQQLRSCTGTAASCSVCRGELHWQLLTLTPLAHSCKATSTTMSQYCTRRKCCTLLPSRQLSRHLLLSPCARSKWLRAISPAVRGECIVVRYAHETESGRHWFSCSSVVSCAQLFYSLASYRSCTHTREPAGVLPHH